MKYSLGFFNRSKTSQHYLVRFDNVSITDFTLQPGIGTSKYVTVNVPDGGKIEILVDTTHPRFAAADLVAKEGKLTLDSETPKEWEPEQETGTPVRAVRQPLVTLVLTTAIDR
jgi:hypothetical protein